MEIVVIVGGVIVFIVLIVAVISIRRRQKDEIEERLGRYTEFETYVEIPEMEDVEKSKQQWLSQKHVLEKLVQTDPRFNIINLLRRMGVIAPIQLSFVLGVSLSQTRRYIKELEEMNILTINEDETISLHPTFDEDTMNIKIDTNNN